MKKKGWNYTQNRREKKSHMLAENPRCEKVKTRWINGVVAVGSFLLVSCSPHSWTVVSGKTRQGKDVGKNCLQWQCPCASTACLAFLDIALFLLLPVTQTSDKYISVKHLTMLAE